MNIFTNGLKSFSQLPISDLIPLFKNITGVSDGDDSKNVFTKERTFWLFLHQTVINKGSCRDAVKKTQVWLAINKMKSISSSTSAYCQARYRLTLEFIENALKKSSSNPDGDEGNEWLWNNRKVRVVDGSSVKLSDTQENQNDFPQSKSQKKGCGFPMMKFVGLFSLATGLLIGIKEGNKHMHEKNLFQQLWKYLNPNDVVLTDRGFCAYADIWTLSQNSIDVVMRKHQKRSVGSRLVKKLSRLDCLVEWTKNKAQPKWLSAEEWAAVPETMVLREVTIIVDKPGFRSTSISIVTTLLDDVLYSKASIAVLYMRRWDIELYFRDIKTAMGFEFLKCKTPAMTKKELYMALIAYNCIRKVMISAAYTAKTQVDKISFSGAWSSIKIWMPYFMMANEIDELYDQMIDTIVGDMLVVRPGRREPRAKKLRPKAYQLLSKHRSEFVEIPHRSKYKKKSA